MNQIATASRCKDNDKRLPAVKFVLIDGMLTTVVAVRHQLLRPGACIVQRKEDSGGQPVFDNPTRAGGRRTNAVRMGSV